MLDSAATTSAILASLADRIGADVFQESCQLSTFDSCEESKRDFANFTVQPIDGEFSLDIVNALVGTILTTERDKPPRNSDVCHLSYLKDVHFHELDDPTVGVILDARWAWYWVKSEIRANSSEDPICLRTRFGWTMIGPRLETYDDDLGLEAEVCLLDTHENKEVEKFFEAKICLLEAHEPSLSDELRYLFRHDFMMTENEFAPPEEIHPSQIDEFSLKQMTDSITLDKETGHYSVALPWREGREEAAKVFDKVDSYANAYNRLMKEKHKFRKDPARKEGTFKQIRDTIDQGHARIVTNKDVPAGRPKFHMPIHVVTRPDKPGKFRICQDAPSEVNGTNLNRHLCTGPNMLNKLIGVLWRFRRRKVAISADIKNFFHMIQVAEEDKAALRFLFFEDEDMKAIMELESNVHIFGASSSPPVANFTLKYHAEQIREKYGDDIYYEILRQFYVDDYMSSVDDVESARQLRIQMTKALAEGGFDLCKWASNFPEVLIDEPDTSSSTPPPTSQATPDAVASPETASKSESHSVDQVTEVTTTDIASALGPDDLLAVGTKEFISQEVSNNESKVLGLGYNSKDDSLFVRVSKKWETPVQTKRQMLRLVNSVYDPIGLVTPFSLKGRMMVQVANELKHDWDEPLPDDLLQKFKEWQVTMPLLKTVRVPRWSNSDHFKGSKTDLVIFCDASHEGYGAIAYLRRWFEGESKALVSQIFARGRVVPINTHVSRTKRQEEHNDSIPRLELTAARLAAEMRDLIIRESGEDFARTFMFSDSSTVLNWLSDFDKKFKTFENFRVKKIRLLTEVSTWRHVPTKENPADIVSHGLNADSPSWPFYLSGPQWLSESEENWPPIRPTSGVANSKKTAVDASVAVIRLAAINATDIITQLDSLPPTPSDWRLVLADRVSIWSRKVKRVVYAKRIFSAFLTYLKRKKSKTPMTDLKIDFQYSVSDYKRGEKELVRAIQLRHFEPEILRLLTLGVNSPEAKVELRSKTSKLTNRNPFLDNDLVLRVGGRLGETETMTYDAKFPMILPNKDNNVKALIRHQHYRLAHATINHTYHALRERYYILGGRTTVSEVLRYCVPCQKLEKTPLPQKEGTLPKDRIELVKPFRATGIDVLGPIGVKMGNRATHKRWVLLLTCMATRAISLQPLKDMSTPTLINALVKFHNTFPGLEIIYSDNGTNFKGACREIKDAVSSWNRQQISEELKVQGVEWVWGPPNSPHWGGVYERLVRSAKRHLKFLLERDYLPIDTFETALTQVTAILNSRPLTYASTDVNDMRVLSPANFLYPYMITPSSCTILPSTPADGDRLRSSWRDVRRIAEAFVERWRKEYVTSLLQRTKWRNSTKSPYEGQLVILVDEATPRDKWRIGRVDEILSKDRNHVRRVKITTAEGKQFERHVTKIVPLELEAEEEDNQ